MKMSAAEVNEKVYDHRILTDWSNVSDSINGTRHYSKDMIFNDGHRLSITVYSILFVISTMGNTRVLFLLIKQRMRGPPSRIHIMLMHLAIADLMVTFLLMPLEIVWAYTVQWQSTDFVCRLMSFFRVFGLYLSSFILICISIDRYYAIIQPLKFSINRGRILLAFAWCVSVLCSLPQAFLFHLEEHPQVSGYYQCVTFHSFANRYQNLLYNIASMCAMYLCPLFTFIYCYGAIYMKIYRKSQLNSKSIDRFRRSNDDVLCRAKTRTLKMTIVIVIVFLICWTPYYIICMWYWLDKYSVDKINPLVRKGLFIFASTNSCMNPIVYGLFNIRGRVYKESQLSSITSRHYALSHCETRHRSSSGEFVKLHVNLKSGNYLSTDDTKSCAKSPRRLPTHSLQNSTKETCTDKNPNPNPNTITNLKRKEEEIDIESKLFNGNVIPKVSISKSDGTIELPHLNPHGS